MFQIPPPLGCFAAGWVGELTCGSNSSDQGLGWKGDVEGWGLQLWP